MKEKMEGNHESKMENSEEEELRGNTIGEITLTETEDQTWTERDDLENILKERILNLKHNLANPKFLFLESLLSHP